MGFFSTERLPFGALFNKQLLFTAGVLALSQFNFGFENSTFNNIQAMDAFIQDFGVMGPKGKMTIKPQWLSLFNGFSIVGFAAGVIVGNQLTDRFGRRKTVIAMSCWTLLCTTILITSRNRDQMMAGRALNHMYIGMELACIPLYQAEITPTQARGAMVATYNTALLLGTLIMTIICRATSDLPNKSAYLIPIGLFYVVPSIVFASAFFIPESPRWLVLRERHEEALASLRLLREGKFSEAQIQEELAAIQGACAMQSQYTVHGSFWARWTNIWTRKHIQRTWIVLGTNFFLHGTGNAFASIYGTVFFKSVGSINAFDMSVTKSCCILITSLATLFMVDKVGRRPLLLVGSAVATCALLAMGGLGMMAKKTYSVNSGIVAMMVIFSAGYCMAWGQLSHTITAEIPSAEVRDATYATGSFLSVAVQAAITFGLPYLLNPPYAALGPKVGFIFGSICALSFIFAYFCVPECRGKSLEEIDILFNNKVSVLSFKTAQVAIVPASDMKGAEVEIKLAKAKDDKAASPTVVEEGRAR